MWIASRRSGPQTLLSASSRQTESRPPETSATTRAPEPSPAAATTSSTRCTDPSTALTLPSRGPGSVARVRDEQLRLVAEALQPDLADQLEAEVLGGLFDDGTSREHLAAGGARDDARREVDLPAGIVAVAIERLAIVDPNHRPRSALADERPKAG